MLRVLAESGVQNPRNTASGVKGVTRIAAFSRTYFALLPSIGSSCEMLRYERTPHVSAPKICALGKNTQLVLLYHTRYVQKSKVDVLVKKKPGVQKKKRKLEIEPPRHVLQRQQCDTKRSARIACMSCFLRNLKHIAGSPRAAE